MKRRIFLSTAFATLVLPNQGLTLEKVFYTPGLAEAIIKEGKVVFLDFWTNWCSTCAAQTRVINELRSSDPNYDSKITFITVDWDQYSKAQISKDLKVFRRSTLVAVTDGKVLEPLVAATSRKEIKSLMDAALSVTRN